MSNSYFQFKQFRIEQEGCAMKVTTDACIQGAWTPVLPHVKRVLDIGAGTGLLALMLAQRSPGICVDAIELDRAAAGQARENIDACVWKERLNVMEGDVRDYRSVNKYDLIISNPPFFNNSLLSDKANRNQARHTNSLSYVDLLSAIENNLGEDGHASILLPLAEYKLWKELLDDGDWFELNKLSVKHRPGAEVKRVISVFGKTKMNPAGDSALIIKDESGNYTPAFIDLLAPYYLDL
jgi:tRNA1Val (adenine37-N6)-methyltransferase